MSQACEITIIVTYEKMGAVIKVFPYFPRQYVVQKVSNISNRRPKSEGETKRNLLFVARSLSPETQWFFEKLAIGT